jgi:hypothetical protein
MPCKRPAARQAAREIAAKPGVWTLSSTASRAERALADYIPLSERPSRELRARSAELTGMAATARTASAKVALELLASRFAVMAARRKVAETLDSTCVDTECVDTDDA